MMNRYIIGIVFGSISMLACAGIPGGSAPKISVTGIIKKNVAARGGLQAWRKIKTMTWVGYIESENSPVHNMPFVLKMKRPNKTRFEIQAGNQVSIRMYDGQHGWKLQSGSHGQPVLKPYTKVELNYAHDVYGIDGELVDYKKKGIKLTLDGVEQVEGHKAYRLVVNLPSGNSHHVWVDAKTFLDLRYDRTTRNDFGISATLTVTYRDYRTVSGLEIPFTIEGGATSGNPPYKMVIEKVFINQPLSERQFSKPYIPKPRTNRIQVRALPERPAAGSSSSITRHMPSVFSGNGQ